MVKTRVLIVIVVVLTLVAVVLTAVFLTKNDPDGKTAVVYVDGEIVYKVDLSKVDEPFYKEIVTPYGKNVLLIEKDGIKVSDADCDGQECVQSGYARAAAPIVCLPHRLVVKIIEEDDVDAVSE